jgi:hypothetical protein
MTHDMELKATLVKVPLSAVSGLPPPGTHQYLPSEFAKFNQGEHVCIEMKM